MAKVGQKLASRYVVKSVIGRGGMGEVFLAKDMQEEKNVAIKTIQPISPNPNEQKHFLKHFQEEAELLSRLSHSNLVQVFEHFTSGDTAYMVMELVRGANLYEESKQRSQPFQVRIVLKWANQILDVLDYLHSQPKPVIVRDIKPHNIVLRDSGDICLIDFGIAREIAPGKETATVLKGIGSEGFAPLEQYGQGTTDKRTDIYALGATLYYLLTLSVPPSAVVRATGQESLENLCSLNPDVDNELATAIEIMLKLSPGERPSSIQEVRRLGPFFKDTSPVPTSVSRREKPPIIVKQLKQPSHPKQADQIPPPQTPGEVVLSFLWCIVVGLVLFAIYFLGYY